MLEPLQKVIKFFSSRFSRQLRHWCRNQIKCDTNVQTEFRNHKVYREGVQG